MPPPEDALIHVMTARVFAPDSFRRAFFITWPMQQKIHTDDRTTFRGATPAENGTSDGIGPAAHPERPYIFRELHSSPFFEVQAPARLFSFALFFDEDKGEQERAVSRLAEAMGCTRPPAGTRHFSAANDTLTFYWSLHTEFARYTFVLAEEAHEDLLAVDVACELPVSWLHSLNGQVIAATQFVVGVEDDSRWDALREGWFGANHIIGGDIGGGRGRAYTDYRLHPAGPIDGGATRHVIFDRAMGPQQTGKMVQRLIEIETYVSLSLLSLPLAKRQMTSLDVLGIELRKLTDLTEREELRDESLLKRLENLAAELERLIAESQYRFSASHAYHKLVEGQVAELDAIPAGGAQPFRQFIWRRLGPAMMTCATVEQRQDRLAQRVQRTTALLRTRVEVTHEKQNRELLAGMARRAELQLRLQETVEGLSIWVLTYYAVALLSHALNTLEVLGVEVHAELVAGVAVAPVAFLFWLCTRAAKRRYGRLHAAAPDGGNAAQLD